MQSEKIKQVRAELKEKSNSVKQLVKEGKFPTINEALVNALYKNEFHREFKPLIWWNREKKFVKKGEHAFVIWGKPKTVQLDSEEDDYSFFPVCYVFSNAQVK